MARESRDETTHHDHDAHVRRAVPVVVVRLRVHDSYVLQGSQGQLHDTPSRVIAGRREQGGLERRSAPQCRMGIFTRREDTRSAVHYHLYQTHENETE